MTTQLELTKDMKYRLRTYQAMNVGPPPKYVNMDLNFQFGI
jgi:hypothetical protein